MAYRTEPRGGRVKSTRRATGNGEVVAALVQWAVCRGWTARTSPDGCCHFYDPPQGEYVAYWPSNMSSGPGHRW